MNDNLVTIGAIVAILGILLLGSLNVDPTPEVLPPAITKITIMPPETLEMLYPVFSEKAVYADSTIRISFNVSQTADGVESRLPFWLHNTSDDVITVLWEYSSLQLPCANTVNIINEAQISYKQTTPARLISIASGGDLFDAVIPISEFTWTADGLAVSTGVLDQGPFRLVLAIEMRGECGLRQIRHYTFRFIVR